MSGILGRFRIKHEKGADILYTTDISALETFGLKHDEEFQDIRVIEIGTVLNIEGRKLRVVNMYPYFYDNTNDNDGRYGVSLYSAGSRFPFNFDITYYVESV